MKNDTHPQILVNVSGINCTLDYDWVIQTATIGHSRSKHYISLSLDHSVSPVPLTQVYSCPMASAGHGLWFGAQNHKNAQAANINVPISELKLRYLKGLGVQGSLWTCG